jgi:predicted N-acyltransferase
MGNITVENLKDHNNSEYLNFVLSIPDSMIYFTPFYYNFLHKSISADVEVIIAKEGNKIIGALPYAQNKHPEFGVILNSLPWYGSHGGCLLQPGSTHIARKLLLESYCEVFHKKNTLSSTVILTHKENAFAEEYKKIFCSHTFDNRIGQITLLPSYTNNLEEELAKTLKQKTRNQMRKSLKQNFALDSSGTDESWEFLWKTHAENMAVIGGNAKTYGHIFAIRECIPPQNIRLVVAKINGESIAALLCLVFNKTVEYFIPVIRQEFRSSQPLSFLIWETMVWAIKHGYEIWNWGGTHKELRTLHHFKAGWGAKDMPYTYITKLNKEGYDLLKHFGSSIGNIFPYWYFFPFHLL